MGAAYTHRVYPAVIRSPNVPYFFLKIRIADLIHNVVTSNVAGVSKKKWGMAITSLKFPSGAAIHAPAMPIIKPISNSLYNPKSAVSGITENIARKEEIVMF